VTTAASEDAAVTIADAASKPSPCAMRFRAPGLQRSGQPQGLLTMPSTEKKFGVPTEVSSARTVFHGLIA